MPSESGPIQIRQGTTRLILSLAAMTFSGFFSMGILEEKVGYPIEVSAMMALIFVASHCENNKARFRAIPAYVYRNLARLCVAFAGIAIVQTGGIFLAKELSVLYVAEPRWLPASYAILTAVLCWFAFLYGTLEATFTVAMAGNAAFSRRANSLYPLTMTAIIVLDLAGHLILFSHFERLQPVQEQFLPLITSVFLVPALSQAAFMLGFGANKGVFWLSEKLVARVPFVYGIDGILLNVLMLLTILVASVFSVIKIYLISYPTCFSDSSMSADIEFVRLALRAVRLVSQPSMVDEVCSGSFTYVILAASAVSYIVWFLAHKIGIFDSIGPSVWWKGDDHPRDTGQTQDEPASANERPHSSPTDHGDDCV